MANDWTIPGDYVVSQNHGAGLDLSSSHHDYKAGLFTATLEMRDDATKEWLGPKVLIRTDANGTKITKFDGLVVEFPTIAFDHAGVQGLLDRTKIVNFVNTNVPDPR